MSLGKAAVYKHIPTYYPENVGAVGGLVGMIGGLGGFILPIAFGALNELTGMWTSCFMLLFVVVSGLPRLDASEHPRAWRAAQPDPVGAAIPLAPAGEVNGRRDEAMTEKLVIVGNGMAPGRMLEHLLEAAPGRYGITIFNAEPRVNYDRILLSPVLSGEKSFEEIVIHGDGWYERATASCSGRATGSSRSTARRRPSPPSHGVTEAYGPAA